MYAATMENEEILHQHVFDEWMCIVIVYSQLEVKYFTGVVFTVEGILLVKLRNLSFLDNIYIYVCVCVCVCILGV